MTVQLICCSHSPLMVTDVEESEQNVHAEFFQELSSASAALHDFKPDLVVVFGPDHFNGFFYELMPAFCIGTAAEGSKDSQVILGTITGLAALLRGSCRRRGRRRWRQRLPPHRRGCPSR